MLIHLNFEKCYWTNSKEVIGTLVTGMGGGVAPFQTLHSSFAPNPLRSNLSTCHSFDDNDDNSEDNDDW